MPDSSPKRSIDVRVFPPFRPAVKATLVRRAAASALATADPRGVGSVSVVVTDDETLRGLNSRFRGFDEITDVLSFGDASDASLAESGEDLPAFPSLPDENPSLGEVVLSYPLAVRQAGEHNVTAEEEVALLVIHGILHLLGHDHAKPSDEAEMKALEVRALSSVFSARARASRKGV